MFSYRHAFHAANHADVLKHSILIHTINYFKQKETPFWILDSHAGTGMYDLTDSWASQSAEANTGLKKLLNHENAPKLINDYLDLIKTFNHGEQFNFYPGSPAIAYRLIRPQDKLYLFELLEAEHKGLADQFYKNFKADKKQVNILLQDGFAGVIRLLPPKPRRGIIFIDPSYENKADYQQVINTLKAGIKKYAQGTYIIWYPQIQRIQAHEMVRSLLKLPVKWLHTSLTVKQPSSDGRGMHGSGMFIINPPWTLHAELEKGLPWLNKTLSQDMHASYTLQDFEPK